MPKGRTYDSRFESPCPITATVRRISPMRPPIFRLWHGWCNILSCLRKMARTEDLKGERKMNTIMNIDPWGFLDDLLGVPSRTFQAMRARASIWSAEATKLTNFAWASKIRLGRPQCLLSFVSLFCDPMDCNPPGSPIHSISQAK